MHRYLSSFLISVSIYASAILTFVYLQNNTKISNLQPTKDEQQIKFALIKQEIKKPKIIIKKTKPKPKITIKQTKTLKKRPKKEIVKTPNIKSTKAVSKIKKSINILTTQKRDLLKEKYYIEIKNAINKNKLYPKKAVRRGVEGKITIEFILSSQGKLISYKFIKGKKIFKKSIIKAIENSFPIKPPDNTFKNNIELSISIRYILN